MGMMSTMELSRRGLSVVAVDQFTPPHKFGSSHGATRVIRQAYFEGTQYVPMVIAASQRWHALESVLNMPIISRTGALVIADPHSPLIKGMKRSSAMYDLSIELVPPTSPRLSALAIPRNLVTLYESEAGFIRVEPVMERLLKHFAESPTVQLMLNTKVTQWDESDRGVTIHTSHGVVHARQLVITAGPWLATVAPLFSMAVPERQVMYWYPVTRPEIHRQLPVFIMETEDFHVYGFPYMAGEGLKIAQHHRGSLSTDPNIVNRSVDAREELQFRKVAQSILPDIAGPALNAEVCLYTNSPDRHFLIGAVPHSQRAWVAGGFSGHGFKFAPIIGEILADLVEHKRPSFDISFFNPERFV